MPPTYMNENRYSYLASSYRRPANGDYEVGTPESAFEMRVQSLFLEGQQHLQHEEFHLALQAFRELMGLILKTVHPKMPADPNQWPTLKFPADVLLVDTLAAKAAEMLQNLPLTQYTFPPSLMNEDTTLPPAVLTQINPALTSGLQVTSHHDLVTGRLDAAGAAIDAGDYGLAVKQYQVAFDKTPATDAALRGSLAHDLAILMEKSGNRDGGIAMARQSIQLFTTTTLIDGQVQSLETLGGMLRRGGNATEADSNLKRAADLRNTNNLNPVIPTSPGSLQFRQALSGSRLGLATLPTLTRGLAEPALSAPISSLTSPISSLTPLSSLSGLTASAELARAAAESTPTAPQLMAMKYVKPASLTKSYTVRGGTTSASIVLGAAGPASVKAFLQTLSATADVDLLTKFWTTPTQIVAYIPHMYFFIIPMSMADCLAGLGDLVEADTQYRGVLPYPFINAKYEAVKLWTRLAELYLAQGDEAYRRAKDTPAAFVTARQFYERIVLLNRTVNAASPLYQDAKFAALRTRVTTFLAAADPVAFNENPAITRPVLEALSRIQQIQSGLNFFGFAVDYVPPFSFEYLQNTARYFAQQASQIEQRYVQFKSTGENEELRREQLDQQAEVARQTVILEQRGVAETDAGIGVAQAGVNYAEVQRVNAVKSRDDFNAVRWELLELAMLEAWGNAASVGEDDEIRFDIDWTYYQSSDRNRSDVLLDLAGQRTRISHDLEAAKLQRAIDSANAYKAIAQAQLAQAQARKAVAQQRVVIAQLQQKFAEENRDFLDMKEFSAHLWYELARQSKALSRRYLDMATEISFLMERAYNAETERGVRVIRYDYSRTPAGNLMGADFLLQDIDYFTFDRVTTVTTKKIPVKRVVSIADTFPMAFEALRQTGSCVFQTEFADFDRAHPGLYLCKIRNVELLFVGLTGATNLGGTLRNVGVSRFRRGDGSIVPRLYPSDVLPLSQYSIRQDALAFRVNPNDLRLFENSGIDALWQLEVPRSTNTFDFAELLDVHMVLYYDGFFSPSLETTIKAALPTTGNGSRGFAARMWYPDELFYLKNKGEAVLTFEAGMFPHNQVNFKRTDVTLKVTGAKPAISGLTLRLKSDAHATELVLKTDVNGEVNDLTAGQPLRALRNQALLDRWTIRITATDNPTLVVGGALDLRGIEDFLAFFEYSFDYRT